MRRSLSTAIALLLSLATAMAAAQVTPQRTLVLDIDGHAAGTRLAMDISNTLRVEVDRNPAYNLIEAPRESLEELLFAIDCDDPTTECLQILAESYQVVRVVYARLIPDDDLTVNVFDVENLRVVRRWNKRFAPERDFRDYFAQQMAVVLGGSAPVPTQTRLRVTSNVKGARVFINGEMAGTVPWSSQSITPGKVTIAVRADGFTQYDRKMELQSGEDRLYNAVLKPRNAAPLAEPRTQPPGLARDGRMFTYGMTAIVCGLASMAAGGIFGFYAAENETLYAETFLERKAQSLRERAEIQATTANVLYGAGGILVATGVSLVVVSLEPSPETGPEGKISVTAGSGTMLLFWGQSW